MMTVSISSKNTTVNLERCFMINVTINRNENNPVPKPDSGFFYVDQGNYMTLGLPPLGTAMTVYSDSATSCIIVIVVAAKNKETTVSLAHVDSPDCIKAFFNHVKAQQPGQVKIFAQGANPRDNKTSQKNAAQLEEEIKALGATVIEKTLFLLEGNPTEKNRGEFGFQISEGGGAVVTNQPYTLTLTDRDPTCGGQVVYCIMRRQEDPPTEIRNAALPFTHAELVELASIAIKFRKKKEDPATAFVNIVNMENKEIRNGWSSTPSFETPWFSDMLKQGASFALSMSPVVNLSIQYLAPEAERPFNRLRKALLSE